MQSVFFVLDFPEQSSTKCLIEVRVHFNPLILVYRQY